MNKRVKRSESHIFQMKKFHNWIKEQLFINHIGRSDDRKLHLLDLACGRLGDLHKWERQPSIDCVVAVDCCSNSIEEGRKRLSSSQMKDRVELHVQDLKVESSIDFGLFDLITCHFALTHFFDREQSLLSLFGLASKSLKKGGKLIFTYPNGDKMRTFKSCSSAIVEHKTTTTNSVYGNEVLFQLKETVYFDKQKQVIEYLVDVEELIRVAEKYQFKLEERMEFTNWFLKWNNSMSEEEKSISFLNESIVFVRK